MRIRKRAVPFPLSSLLTPDPPINLNRPPPVQLHPGPSSSVTPDRPIGQPIDGSDFSHNKAQLQDSSDDEGEKKRKKKMKENDTIASDKNVNVSACGGTSTFKTNTTTRNIRSKKRSGMIMEGSRCSRVNGRGWRCCQQTLVGYSLCQHHLGKGRLRSKPNTPPKKTTKLGIVKARSLSSLLGQTMPNQNLNNTDPPLT